MCVIIPSGWSDELLITGTRESRGWVIPSTLAPPSTTFAHRPAQAARTSTAHLTLPWPLSLHPRLKTMPCHNPLTSYQHHNSLSHSLQRPFTEVRFPLHLTLTLSLVTLYYPDGHWSRWMPQENSFSKLKILKWLQLKYSDAVSFS